MQNLTVDQRIAQELYKRSKDCVREVVWVDPVERSGLAYVAPNSFMWTWIPLDDGRATPFDFHVN